MATVAGGTTHPAGVGEEQPETSDPGVGRKESQHHPSRCRQYVEKCLLKGEPPPEHIANVSPETCETRTNRMG